MVLRQSAFASGKSINKPNNPKETIGIWQAYDILDKELKVVIPEKTDIELLHEERNNIQHKYANPTPEDADFHVGNAMLFTDRFVRDELKLTLADFIPSEFLTRVLPP
jgi:hypothetical protein